MGKLVFKRFDAERYTLFFNQESGFFARVEDVGAQEPEYSLHGPEILDVSITSYCQRGCSFCYRDSSYNGFAMSLVDYERVLCQAKECDVLQIALGGGNPNEHKNFRDILRMTRLDYDIVPSYTTNGDGLTDDVIIASKEYCGAVAISYYEPHGLFFTNLQKLLENNIKTNIHFLLSANSIKSAIDLLSKTDDNLKQVNAIVFLLYKPVGRASKNGILQDLSLVDEFFVQVKNSRFKIGFDSCSIPGIVNYLKYNPTFIEPCEAGRFSAFVSEDLFFYPCSFMEKNYEGINLRHSSMREAWREYQLFNFMRSRSCSSICKDCKSVHDCRGGCYIFPEINLCRQNKIYRSLS
jgi:radical SAM protein with 4Fe4S-binding SPASM domain